MSVDSSERCAYEPAGRRQEGARDCVNGRSEGAGNFSRWEKVGRFLEKGAECRKKVGGFCAKAAGSVAACGAR